MTSRPLPAFITPGTAIDFPPDDAAMSEPNGLIAVGGDLEPARLMAAYRRGIFPWYEVGQPIMWWTPSPRCVLFPGALHVSRSLRKVLRRGAFRVSFDRAFERVIRACAEPREQDGCTWITAEMMQAYENLHQLGHAHSLEVWRDERLVGGLYGVAIGAAFFGESMFSRESNASKIALLTLCSTLAPAETALIDCQIVSAHLLELGAQTITRTRFHRCLEAAAETPSPFQSVSSMRTS